MRMGGRCASKLWRLYCVWGERKVICTKAATTVALRAKVSSIALVVAFTEQVLVVLPVAAGNDAMAFVDSLATLLGFKALL